MTKQRFDNVPPLNLEIAFHFSWFLFPNTNFIIIVHLSMWLSVPRNNTLSASHCDRTHSDYTSQVFKFTSELCLIIFMHVAFYCTPKIQHVAVTFNDTDRPLHMERYTANLHNYNNLFMAPPSEKREIWGAIIGSPHMYSPQCAPRSLHGEHFDGNLLYYTLTFRQWLHALSLLPWLLMAILKCCLWQSGCK